MIEMNNIEKNKLIDKSKSMLRSCFHWMSNLDSLRLVNETELKNSPVFYLNEIDAMSLICKLLNAKRKTYKTKCPFNNEYLDGDAKSGRYFIYGEAQINVNLEEVVSISPSDGLIYENDEIDDTNDYSNDFLSNINISNINMYKGTFSYSGILNEFYGDNYADLTYMNLYNNVDVLYIDSNEPSWKKYIANSYKLYDGESYELAFLTAFIGFDNLIELLNEKLKDVYYSHQIEMITFTFSPYNSNSDFINVLEKDILDSESYLRLKKLQNSNRKLIREKLITILRFIQNWTEGDGKKYVNELVFYEYIRNSLAHGNDIQQKFIIENTYFKNYESSRKQLDFERLYKGLIVKIYLLLIELMK